MTARAIGTICGAALGFLIGAGTGIVGGPFGAMAGVLVFTTGGAIWGFSAGPDLALQINRWRSK